jgi:hypothetical protein
VIGAGEAILGAGGGSQVAKDAQTGLDAVLGGPSRSSERERLAAQIAADDDAVADTDPLERGRYPVEDEQEPAAAPKRGGRWTSRYGVHGGEAQITLITFPLGMTVFYGFEAYRKRRLALEAELSPDSLDVRYADLPFPEQVAAMIEDLVGRAIVADLDLAPEDRVFDWAGAITPALSLVIEQQVQKRLEQRRSVLDQMIVARVRARFPNASDEDLRAIVGEVTPRAARPIA